MSTSKILLAADNDRDMLEYLHDKFQSETNVCEQCGNEEPTNTCDSVSDLQNYLNHFQSSAELGYDEIKEKELCSHDWLNSWTKTESTFEVYLDGWLACAKARDKNVST